MSSAGLSSSRQDTGFLAGGGEMAALIRAKDWSTTPLGPIRQWPQSLRTTVSLCLASNFPINIIWGPEHTQIYNDGYRVLCGEGHPAFLGMDYSVSWASAWPAIGEPFVRAMAGDTSYLENQRMFLSRNGYLEETFFTFSLSPIRDETGGIGGLFHPVTETTAIMLGERRTRAVRDLTAHLSNAKITGEVFERAVETLAGYSFDLPFVLLYRLERDGEGNPLYRLAAQTGLNAGTEVSPEILYPDAAAPWPIGATLQSQAAISVADVAGLLGSVPCGPYDEPPSTGFVVPIILPGSDLPAAILIAGASARLPLDDAYRGFYDLIAAAFGAALGNAQAYEEERQRAEALAAIDRAKTAFFSNVSHEFRTPLTLMLGPLEDVLADPAGLPGVQRGQLQLAHRNALRLLKLVNSLLDFSRIEAGRAEASFEPTDLAAVTADLASNFRSACDRAGLDLVVDCPSLGTPVHVDRDMWEKIVLNLLSNAFKFTLEGRITVSLRGLGSEVELTVRDTGVGISAIELPRVFERFHRIEGQRGRTHEGTGIGLALVDELVRLHGGRIGVSSAPGQGAEFRVAIPLGTAHLPPDRIRGTRELASTAVRASAFVEEALRWLPDCVTGQPGKAVESEAGLSPAEGQPRIVLADDNADMRSYVARILDQGGYAVEAVTDGEAALAAARRGAPPALVLTDVMMPGLDGFGLLRELRSDPVMEAVLVIMLSARAGEEARVEGLAAGADDYLVKPFSARELRARIDGAVGLARQRREAAARERDLREEIAAERGRAALREFEQRLAFALEAGRLGSWEADLVTQEFTASDIARLNLGFTVPGPALRFGDVLERVYQDDLNRMQATISSAIEIGDAFVVEFRIKQPDDQVSWVMLRGQAEYASDGSPVRMRGVSLDVTARKQAEERQELLTLELDHRAKNMLAVVQAALRLTRTEDLDSFIRAIEGRVASLARAQTLLAKERWSGADFHALLRGELAAFLDGGGSGPRATLHGPRVAVPPNAVQPLSMAVHELTNAVKHGALSVPDGRIHVTWEMGPGPDRLLRLRWTESGGPKPKGPPARRGFGTRMLSGTLRGQLGGAVSTAWEATGLVCEMEIPIGRLLQSSNFNSSPRA
jgi:signal transduction histidine kinase/DNA-binding response OmpR family regulator